ncbi:fibrillin-1 [Microplitis demolitor]|uniref:fibrillin-1 n=1 Tax=Microplitis demolitor TaxID=69319 RepID=UPI0004CD92C2|nr:fibrillin-1 [Microplitis demolitor]
MSTWRFLFFLTNFLIAYPGNDAQAKVGAPFKKCCDVGTSWAKEGLRCEKFAGPVEGVPTAEQGLCLESVDICCIRAYHELSCGKGKKNAREGKACVDGDAGKSRIARSLGDYQRDCCEGCKLGILTGSLGQECALNDFSFGNPWDPAFLECCRETSTTTPASTSSKTEATTKLTRNDNRKTTGTTKAMTSSTSSSSRLTSLSTESSGSTDSSLTDTDDGIPTPPIDDICQLLKNLLCSHICVPTPGSYYCECPEGYVLLEDEQTCRTDTPINRCESDNPCEHRCTDTGTAVKCECDPGFELAKDGHSCQLKPTQVTTTLKPRDKSKDKKKPRCPPGYRFNASVRVCDDVDECLENPCRAREKCENVVGSYICVSKKRGSKSKLKTQEIQEIQFDFKESCPPGYQWDEQFQVCSDIDECASEINVSPCPIDTHFCVNTEGSYACHKLTESKGCPAGFKFNVTKKICQDVDECVEGLHGCLPEVEECRNTEGAYECDIQCRKGFTFSRSLGICVDINECEELYPCPSDKPICINLPGTYQCAGRYSKEDEFDEATNLDDDDDGDDDENENEIADERQYEAASKIEDSYLVNDENKSSTGPASSPLVAACEPGYQWIDNNCFDVNECAVGPGCQDHERCVNRLGGYDCLPLCSTGWYFDRTNKQCRDVDECLLGRHDCSQDTQVCRNTNGSYVCDEIPSCLPGFRRAFNGTCVDIDECIDKLHNCPLHLHQYCVNRVGTFECVTRLPDCTDGYRFSVINKRCEDIDECSTKSPCDTRLQERCVNLPGSYRCDRSIPMAQIPKRRPACPSGYRYDSKSRQCEDIDECAEKVNLCGTEVCYNQPGGYTCARAPTPITEPTTQEDSETQSTVIPNDPQTCSEGLKHTRNRGCVDINECEEVEDACSSNEECVNTVGSYTCNCRIGFRRDNLTQACVDINECQLLENDCLPTQRCDNTLGSYNCVRFLPCGTGYTLNAATEICEDDDECLLGTHDCSDGYHCRNTLGSYRCDRNLKGQTWTTRRPPVSTSTALTTTTITTTSTSTTTTPRSRPRPRTTTQSPARDTPTRATPTRDTPTRATPTRVTPTRVTPPRSRVTPTLPDDTRTTAVTSANTPAIGSRNKPEPISCPRGFESGPSGQCIDIDECYGPSNPCARSPLQRCVNTVGSYRCVSRVICGAGWTLDPETSRCVDLDECATGTHECGPDQTCENRQGGYLCSCPAGHALGPNRECIDIDECSIFNGNVCGSSGRCENTVGSFRCVCDAGFEKSSKGIACQDINECERSPGICQHNCFNMWGSYRCSCKPGYRLNADNRSCVDIDECTEFRENNLCIGICDNTPGSYSCRCPDGYRLGSDARTCQDIDECANGRMCRDPEEICQNTRGSFRCNKIDCPPGYHQDPTRQNRCVRSSRYCPSGDLACFRSPSHFSFNFITFVSMLPLPVTGQLELFTMRGTHLPGSVIRFSMALIDARAPPGIMRATESCFALRRPSPSQAVLVLTRSLPGPQDIELDLSMEIYHNNAFAGSAVAKLFIFVTQYEF